MHFSFYYYW